MTRHSFEVHIHACSGQWRVYLRRYLMNAIDPRHHKAMLIPDMGKAEIYALALSEVHGDCPVYYH